MDFLSQYVSVAAFNRSVNGTNTFQTLLATDGFSSYVVLTYGDMQWPDGAVIGFNDGGDGTSANLLASVEDRRSADVVTGTNVPNLGFSGLYIYRVNDLSRVPRSGSGSGSGSVSGSGSGSGDGSGSCFEGLLRPADPTFTNSLAPSGNSLNSTLMSGVEICIGGVYGGICDVGWDDRDARVACNKFGYTDGELASMCGPHPSPPLPPLLLQVPWLSTMPTLDMVGL